DGGDPAGAIRHGERHAELLEAELELPADPAVLALVHDLRNGQEGFEAVAPTAEKPGAHEPGNVHSGGPPPPRPASAGSSSRHAPVGRLRWVGAVVVLAAVVGSVALLGRSPSAPARVPDRTIVFPLVPHEDDEELRGIGRLAASHILLALVQAEVGSAVLARGEAGTPDALGPEPSTLAAVVELARERGANLAVTGRVERDSAGTRLSAIIVDPDEGLAAAAIGPLAVDPRDPAGALTDLRSRVVGAIAARRGEDAPEHPFVVRTPSWESFRAADRATERFLRRDFGEAARLYREAYELDTTAVGYLLWEGISESNRSGWSAVSEVLEELAPRRGELSDFDATQYDWLSARLRGDGAGVIAAARAAGEIAPTSGLGGFQLGLELKNIGEFQESIDVLRSLDPDVGWLREFDDYWLVLASSYHLLGRHEEELEVARRGYDRHPTRRLLASRVRALAALGRLLELEAALRESTDLPYHLFVAAQALQRHGQAAAAIRFANEGVRVLDARRADGAAGDEEPAVRFQRAQLLMVANRLAEARILYEELLREYPNDRDLLGWNGFVTARLWDEETAREMIARLRVDEQEPRRWPGRMIARAIIETELGTDPALVRQMLERAFRAGWRISYFHYTPSFDRIRAHPGARGFFERAGAGSVPPASTP
ncbi:MAG: hypothetical protein MJB57_14285, partial [Gemmatimonadetes bacterium]|nr:hypothetical protein [Gemmatimonadota bacterium]